MTPFRIVLVGGTRRMLKTLRTLAVVPGIEIVYAIFQADYEWDPQWHQDLEREAAARQIPFETYASSRRLSRETIEHVRTLAPDAIIGGGIWRAILPAALWETTRYGYVSLHGSLLPAYRGSAGLNWHIINGEREFGMQAFRLDAGIDSGLLIYRKSGAPLRRTVPLGETSTIAEILDEVDAAFVDGIGELVDCLRRDDVVFIEQDHDRATWTAHRTPDDGEIVWNATTAELVRFVRAQSRPFTGAFSFYRNRRFHVWKVSVPPEPRRYVGRIPGKIAERHESGAVDVLTGDGILRLEEISVDGESISPAALLTSHKERLGFNARAAIASLDERVATLEAWLRAAEEGRKS